MSSKKINGDDITATKTSLQVAQASRDVRNYIKDTGTLPEKITFNDGSKVNRATFLRMMSIAIALIKTGNKSTILDTSFRNPPQVADQAKAGQWKIDSYPGAGYDTSNYMVQTGITPTLNYTPFGNLSFFGIIWTFSRVLGWYYENGQKLPAYVEVASKFGAMATTVKTQLWLDLEDSLGAEFNTPEELEVAFQNHPDYELYYNDQKKQSGAISALKVVGKPGVNCVDVAQLTRQVLIDMGEENVHIWRGTFNCGGHVWVTYGSNNKIFDAAGMMKWGYSIGQYMCSGTPWDLNKDPAWALSDDGET